MSDKSSKGFFLGLIAGGIIGATIALLYAPKSGKEMHETLKKNSQKILGEAEEFIDVAKNTVTDVINEAKRKSEELVSHAKKQAEDLIAESEELLIKAKDKKINDEIDEDPISGIDAYKKDKI